MKATLQALLTALFLTAVVIGPIVGMMFWSWRSVLAGALGTGAFFIGAIVLLGAGGAGPGQNPLAAMVVGFAFAAVLAYAAWWVAQRGGGIRPGAILFGATALAWALMMKGQLSNAWWVVFNPDAAARVYAKRPPDKPRRPDIMARAAYGADIAILTDETFIDIVYLEPGRDSSDRLIQLLRDPTILSRTGNRALNIIVPERGTAADSLRGRVLTPIPSHPLKIESVPSFYDPATGSFRLGVYEWMTTRAHLEPDTATAIYSRYFGGAP